MRARCLLEFAPGGCCHLAGGLWLSPSPVVGRSHPNKALAGEFVRTINLSILAPHSSCYSHLPGSCGPHGSGGFASRKVSSDIRLRLVEGVVDLTRLP